LRCRSDPTASDFSQLPAAFAPVLNGAGAIQSARPQALRVQGQVPSSGFDLLPVVKSNP
jgi:hypothetical protein